MKKTILLFALMSLTSALHAGGRIAERTYISTDKEVYVAGERIWCSAFCLDAGGKLTGVSSLVFVELHSNTAMVAAVRLMLESGRGAGYIDLPPSLPTGNYRLVAYTSQNIAEEGYDYDGLASKIISVFNVLTNERAEGGVETVSPGEYMELAGRRTLPDASQDGPVLAMSWNDDGVLVLENRSGKPLTMSLSVYHDDGILSAANPGIKEFVSQMRGTRFGIVNGARLPDYEGEVIYGRIVGFSGERLSELTGKYAFISSPSDKSDVYAAPIRSDGSLTFFTGGIFGNKECICEIEDIDPKLSCHVELYSPYVNGRVSPVPVLKISESLEDILKEKSVAMQIGRRFSADTLFDFLPRRTDGLFDENVVVRYVLDDYTRFTTMEEVFIEFIPEIRARKRSDGGRDIKVRLADSGGGLTFSSNRSLMLLDGVPVFDQQKIMDYDPLLVETIDIYPCTHFICNRQFDGIVNFVTYKRNLPSFRFDGNARVIDYQGICHPVAVTADRLEGRRDYPDYRQTILWQPLLELDAGETLVLECSRPLYKGIFRAVAEGLDMDGEAVSGQISFELQ